MSGGQERERGETRGRGAREPSRQRVIIGTTTIDVYLRESVLDGVFGISRSAPAREELGRFFEKLTHLGFEVGAYSLAEDRPKYWFVPLKASPILNLDGADAAIFVNSTGVRRKILTFLQRPRAAAKG